jgi:uncharacterized protein YjdB
MNKKKKVFKTFAALLAALLLVVSLPITTFAASDTKTITGDSTVDDVTLKVTVPMNLDFALDPLELNVTSGSQVATTDYFFVNKTAAPVKVAVSLTAVPTNGAVLVDDPDTLSPYDTEVTTKELYFAALGATAITKNDLDFDYVTTTGAIAPVGTYSSTSTALTCFNSTDKKASIAFALDKATNVDTDGTPTTGAALAVNDKGVATFQFYSKMNTYADWTANDINVDGNYTLTALSATTYSNYTTNSSYESDGFNQLKVNKPVTGITVTSSAITMAEGDTLQMNAIVTPSNATNKDVTWSVADETGSATITTGGGLLTATGDGTVTVTATANDGSGITGTLQITITSSTVAVTGITVTSTAISVNNGSTLQMTAIVLPDDASDKTVTWSVENGTGSATISTSSGLLTGTSPGAVTVKATANDGSDITGTLQITVNPVYTTAGFIVTGSSVTLANLTSASAITSPTGSAVNIPIPFYFKGLTITSLTLNTIPVDPSEYMISGNNLVMIKASSTCRLRTASATTKTMVLTLSDGLTHTFYITVTP